MPGRRRKACSIFKLQRHTEYAETYILVRISGVTKWGKVTKWGCMVMEEIGSTCNVKKLTGKGQVEGKYRSEAYGHQKLKQKGNQGQGSGYPCTGLSCVCLEVA